MSDDINAGDSMDWTPGQACRSAADRCDREDMDCALVILLDRGAAGKEFNTAFLNSGLTMVETVALLAILQADFHAMIREQPPSDA